MDKVLDLLVHIGITATDFIEFAIGDFTKYGGGQKRAGGIFELRTKRYDAKVLEFCARVAKLNGKNGNHGPFSAKILGGFAWYPGEPMDLDMFAEHYDSEPTATRSKVSMEHPISYVGDNYTATPPK